jgi:opacity protein-like surface antigen
VKKIVTGILLSACVAMPALAAEQAKFSVGGGYGFNYGGVLSFRGDYDISKLAKNEPVKVRVGYDRYSENFGGNYSWSYNVFYGGAYYDFNKILKLDSKIHPFAGLGLGFGSVSCTGNWCNNSWVSKPTVGGLYYIGGLQYDILPNVNAEVSYSAFGGITVGGNFKF